jgi:hypothetical protein
MSPKRSFLSNLVQILFYRGASNGDVYLLSCPHSADAIAKGYTCAKSSKDLMAINKKMK